MLLFTKLFLYRVWQRKLYNLVQKEEHWAEMYACLWMLIVEQAQVPRTARTLCELLGGQGNSIYSILPEGIQ